MSLTPVANRKIFNQKSFNYLVWTPLGSRINITVIFSFKFTLSCKQSDIVLIICTGVVDHGDKFTAGVVDFFGGKLPLVSTNLLPLSLTPVANLPPASTTPAVQVAKFATSVVDTGGVP
jgi:hypothetical protein